jgi:hypothetical protein
MKELNILAQNIFLNYDISDKYLINKEAIIINLTFSKYLHINFYF